MKTTQPRLLRLIIVLVSLGLSIGAVRTIVDLLHRKGIVAQRQAELVAKKAENEQLRAQMQDVQSEGYVERVARNTLGLVKEGESIVLLGGKESEAVQENHEEPNWMKWWRLFF
jgi:cell division protein FtsB